MVGLHSGTHSRLAVIGGVLTVAVADAFSDALGIHIAEEAEDKHTHLEVWESTIATFVTKFFFAINLHYPCPSPGPSCCHYCICNLGIGPSGCSKCSYCPFAERPCDPGPW